MKNYLREKFFERFFVELDMVPERTLFKVL